MDSGGASQIFGRPFFIWETMEEDCVCDRDQKRYSSSDSRSKILSQSC